MTSFIVSITNNSGHNLTTSNAYVTHPGYIIPSMNNIANNSTEEITITLDNPKDPCSCAWDLSVDGHPFKILVYLNNPLGSEMRYIKLSAFYLEKVWSLTSVKLGVTSGCAADKITLTIPPIQLVTILP